VDVTEDLRGWEKEVEGLWGRRGGTGWRGDEGDGGAVAFFGGDASRAAVAVASTGLSGRTSSIKLGASSRVSFFGVLGRRSASQSIDSLLLFPLYASSGRELRELVEHEMRSMDEAMERIELSWEACLLLWLDEEVEGEAVLESGMSAGGVWAQSKLESASAACS
jgi:hypothetical protein